MPSHGEAFEEYCARIEARLRERVEERRGFLQDAVERLEALHAASRTLGDTELEPDLAARLDEGRKALSGLDAAGELLPGTAAPEASAGEWDVDFRIPASESSTAKS